MVSSIDHVPAEDAAIELGNSIEDEINEQRALRCRRPFDEDEFVLNPASGELRSVEAQGAEETSFEISAVIIVAAGQDDAEQRSRPDCVRRTEGYRAQTG